MATTTKKVTENTWNLNQKCNQENSVWFSCFLYRELEVERCSSGKIHHRSYVDHRPSRQGECFRRCLIEKYGNLGNRIRQRIAY